MTFEVHEAIINYFFFELEKDPMEGFGQVTLQQVAAADRELHVRLAEATRGGFKTGPAGELPLDIHVKRILDGPELKWMLMPLPKRAAGKPTTDGPSKPSNDAESKRNKAEPNKTKQDSLKLKRLKRNTHAQRSWSVVFHAMTKVSRCVLRSTLGHVLAVQIARRGSTCVARKAAIKDMRLWLRTSKGLDYQVS